MIKAWHSCRMTGQNHMLDNTPHLAKDPQARHETKIRITEDGGHRHGVDELQAVESGQIVAGPLDQTTHLDKYDTLR